MRRQTVVIAIALSAAVAAGVAACARVDAPAEAGAAPSVGLLAAVAEQPAAPAQATAYGPRDIAPVGESRHSDGAVRQSQVTAGQPRKITMIVTAYCPCRQCCGRHNDGKTASGSSVGSNGGRFVAADTGVLPFGTRVSVPGYKEGRPVPVLDRGGAIKGNRLDVFFRSHRQAKAWGVRRLTVTVHDK